MRGLLCAGGLIGAQSCSHLLLVNIDLCFITYFCSKWTVVVFVLDMTESVEQLKRKVANLMQDSEDLNRFRKDIDWLKTIQKKVVKDKFD
jgi:hypothetical protein